MSEVTDGMNDPEAVGTVEVVWEEGQRPIITRADKLIRVSDVLLRHMGVRPGDDLPIWRYTYKYVPEPLCESMGSRIYSFIYERAE